MSSAKRLGDVGRLIIPAIRLDRRPVRAEQFFWALHWPGPGGFVIFGGERLQVLELCVNLQAYASHPLLLAADLERGAGQQVRGLSQVPPPAALAWLEDSVAAGEGRLKISTARLCAAYTASEARRVGLNWALAPVADLDLEPANPIVQTRSFGPEPAGVSKRIAKWIQACQEAGVLACAKHFPGHGRAAEDSHRTLPVVRADRRTLESDLEPFRAAVAQGVASVMTAHVAYPALDKSGAPATFSKRILTGILRRELGYEGLIVSDALVMAGARSPRGEAEAAVRALKAGCDLLLYPSRPELLVHQLNDAIRARELPKSVVHAALERVEHAAQRAVTHPRYSAMTHEFVAQHAAQMRDDVLTWRRGEPQFVKGAAAVEIVDDDAEGAGGYPLAPRSCFAEELEAQGVAVRPDAGYRLVLVFADVKSWKGRAGLSAASSERLAGLLDRPATVILCGHPRRLADIPGAQPVLCAWSGDEGMQRAAARRIAGRAG